MDIEDLFTEVEEETKQVMVIPEFGPCGGDDEDAISSQQKKQQKCCQGQSLTCSTLGHADGCCKTSS
jgi:hypothetical protein